MKTRQAASSCLPYWSDTAGYKLSIIRLVYNAIDTLLRFPSGCDYNYHPRTRTTAAHCEATRGRVMASATSCLIVPNCNGVDTADAVHHAVTASAYASRRWQYDNSMATAATSCLIVPNCNGVDTVLRVWSGSDCNRVRSPPLLIQLATSCLSYVGSTTRSTHCFASHQGVTTECFACVT